MAVSSSEVCWASLPRPHVWQSICCQPSQGVQWIGQAVRTGSCFSSEFRSQDCCQYLPLRGDDELPHVSDDHAASADLCFKECSEQDLYRLAGNVSQYFPTRCAIVRLVRLYHEILRHSAWIAWHPSSLRRRWHALVDVLDLCWGVSDFAMWRATHLTIPTIRYGLNSILHVASARAALTLPSIRHPGVVFAEVSHRPLVLEVGAAGGITTRHHLRQGYAVVAVEPNPSAAAALRTRLASDIGDGSLRLLPVAIRGQGEPSSLLFFSDSTRPQISQLYKAEHRGTTGVVANITAMTCGEIAQDLGRRIDVAIIDAESRSVACVRALCRGDVSRHLPPRFLSVETDDLEQELQLLQKCGYVGFKLVRQARFYLHTSSGLHDGLFGHSSIAGVEFGSGRMHEIEHVGESGAGPSGDEALDWAAGPQWRSADEVAKDFKLLQHGAIRGIVWRQYIQADGSSWSHSEWFDVHARHREQ